MNLEFAEFELKMLDDCAHQLELTREQTMLRAMVRLHCALFQSEDELDDIDYGKSLDLSCESPRVLQCMFAIAYAKSRGEG